MAAHFRKVAQRLQDAGILDPKVLRVDTNTLLYQVPGGMLSNLISQLKQAGKEDKYYDVLAEIPASARTSAIPAGNALLPDRGHPGRDERHHGRALQDVPQGEPRHAQG